MGTQFSRCVFLPAIHTHLPRSRFVFCIAVGERRSRHRHQRCRLGSRLLWTAQPETLEGQYFRVECMFSLGMIPGHRHHPRPVVPPPAARLRARGLGHFRSGAAMVRPRLRLLLHLHTTHTILQATGFHLVRWEEATVRGEDVPLPEARRLHRRHKIILHRVERGVPFPEARPRLHRPKPLPVGVPVFNRFPGSQVVGERPAQLELSQLEQQTLREITRILSYYPMGVTRERLRADFPYLVLGVAQAEKHVRTFLKKRRDGLFRKIHPDKVSENVRVSAGGDDVINHVSTVLSESFDLAVAELSKFTPEQLKQFEEFAKKCAAPPATPRQAEPQMAPRPGGLSGAAGYAGPRTQRVTQASPPAGAQASASSGSQFNAAAAQSQTAQQTPMDRMWEAPAPHIPKRWGNREPPPAPSGPPPAASSGTPSGTAQPHTVPQGGWVQTPSALSGVSSSHTIKCSASISRGSRGEAGS